MNIFKVSFILTIISLTLTNCKNDNNQNEIALKDFFYQIDNYETEKVLIYEHHTSGIKTNNYFILKKVDGKKLEVTRLSEKFQIIQTYTDLYEKDGVYLESSTFVEGENSPRPVSLKVSNGKIFPFDNLDAEIVSTSTFNSVVQPNIRGTINDHWKFKKIVEKEIDGKKVKVIYANGDSERTYADLSTGQNSRYTMKIEYQYTEGIGLTSIESTSIGATFKDIYKKTISIEEFNEMRKL